MTECSNTVFISLLSPSFSSSTLAPEIRDIYPGTRGSTQGEMNERKPATNAAIMNVCFLLHCNLNRRSAQGQFVTGTLFRRDWITWKGTRLQIKIGKNKGRHEGRPL